MPEFLNLVAPTTALDIFLSKITPALTAERVSLSAALGRVTSAAVIAPIALPPFARSAVDGYALRATDTYGASDSLPAYLSVVGEVPMGAAPDFEIGPGQAALVHTGGMLPMGVDAVVMLEYTQSARLGEVEVLRAAAVGENVIFQGEDVQAGQEVIPAGRKLRPAEIGGLAALGLQQVEVVRRPRVGILSTGDEVVPLGNMLRPGQVYDVNSYSLGALVEQAGGESVQYGILPDRPEALQAAAVQALAECDLVVITAGSSASTRDLTAQVINGLGRPGVLVHGVNVRPGKPTILAVCQGKGVVGLPGNPVSALVIAWLFVLPAIEHLLGLSTQQLRPLRFARLTVNLPSQAGREDWVPVRLLPGPGMLEAEPVFGKSNLIFTLARADGLVRIPADSTGLEAGEIVEVHLSAYSGC